MLMFASSFSIKMHFLFSSLQITPDVPDPAKQSKTVSPGKLPVVIILL